MKTINFLTSHFIPENTACSNRVLAFVRKLGEKYKINVICLTEKGSYQKHNHVKYNNNIDIYYVNQQNYDGRNFFKRAFFEIIYIHKLTKITTGLSSDLIIATSPYMFMIPMVGFRMKGPRIIDIRDLVWEYLDDRGIVKKIIKYTLKTIMKQSIKKFDHVSVTNDYEYNLLKKKYGIKNINIIPNGIERNKFKHLTSLHLNNQNEQITVTYVGNLGLAQNLMTLVKAAEQLPSIKFFIIGSGIEAVSIKNYIDRMGIQNIEMTGKLTWQELKDYYMKTSILYAQLDRKFISAMPSKLYEYAAIGLPIIYGGVGQAVTFVNQLENATIIEPNDVDRLVYTIKRLAKSPKYISDANRKLIEKYYIRENSSDEIVSIVDKII